MASGNKIFNKICCELLPRCWFVLQPVVLSTYWSYNFSCQIYKSEFLTIVSETELSTLYLQGNITDSHAIFETLFRLSTTFISGNYVHTYIDWQTFRQLQAFTMYMNLTNNVITVQSPCFLLFSFLISFCPLSFPSTYLEPSLLW